MTHNVNEPYIVGDNDPQWAIFSDNDYIWLIVARSNLDNYDNYILEVILSNLL